MCLLEARGFCQPYPRRGGANRSSLAPPSPKEHPPSARTWSATSPAETMNKVRTPAKGPARIASGSSYYMRSFGGFCSREIGSAALLIADDQALVVAPLSVRRTATRPPTAPAAPVITKRSTAISHRVSLVGTDDGDVHDHCPFREISSPRLFTRCQCICISV